MRPKRPEFSLPSTKPAAGTPAKTEWVYRSDAAAPIDRPAAAPSEGRVPAKLIIERYATYAGGAAIIPIPYFDVLAIGTVQLKMLAELCANHDVPFNNVLGKSLVAALVGGIGATRLGLEVGGSLLKSVPVVGALGSLLAMPAMAYGATWAIGKVFAMHLESGGTLLDVDVTHMRAHVQNELAATVR